MAILPPGRVRSIPIRIAGAFPTVTMLQSKPSSGAFLMRSSTPSESGSMAVLPCVVAADGNRDSMPVSLKEAMALELPVVGTDEVGLPELIGPDRGRLVAPRDAEALAGALVELAALAPGERVALGRAGRAFVHEHCNLRTETGKLLGLFARAA